MTHQERLEWCAANPGFEKSRLYGHLFKSLTKEDLERIEWLRTKRRAESRHYVQRILNESKKTLGSNCGES